MKVWGGLHDQSKTEKMCAKKRLIRSPNLKDGVLEDKINLNFPNNHDKYFVIRFFFFPT